MHFATMHLTILLSAFVSLRCFKTDTEYFLKPMGNVYFSDFQYTLKFDLSLNDYYSNAKMLNYNTMELEELCNSNNNSILSDCIYFHNTLKDVTDKALKEIAYVNTNVKMNRNKREIICLALVAVGTAVAAAIAGFFTGMAVVAATQKDLINQSNIQHTITHKQMYIDEKNAEIANKTTNFLSISMHQLTDAQYINQLLISSLFAVEKHHKDSEKYFNILNDNLQSRFFDTIDVITFQETIQKIKGNATINSPIFALKPHEIIKMSELKSEFLNDTIRINVYIPLSSKEKFQLYSFTPVPINKDYNTFILNLNSKYLIRNNSFNSEIR